MSPRANGKSLFDAAGPDGVAADADGHVFATYGGTVAIIRPDGKKIGALKIQQGSGTNLCFGGERGEALFLTTFNALYLYDPVR